MPAAARMVHASERADCRPTSSPSATSIRRCMPGPAGAGLQDDRHAASSRDREFLSRASFQKLLINFTWWVNRKDVRGKHLFAGGFLGLDNIGVFDRSQAAARRRPAGAGRRHRLDGVLLRHDAVDGAGAGARRSRRTEDIASKFFEHFVAIADAMNTLGGTGLWDEEDGFYYDQLHVDGQRRAAAAAVDGGADSAVRRRGAARTKIERPARFPQADGLVPAQSPGPGPAHHLHGSAADDERQRPPPAGDSVARAAACACCATCSTKTNSSRPMASARSRSVTHAEPYVFRCGGQEFRVQYVPGESDSGMFGGNSNWRGPIWFPINYLLIEALRPLPPLLRRRLEGRMSHRLRPLDDARRSGAGIGRAAGEALSQGRQRAAAVSRQAAARPQCTDEPLLVLRILRRRDRPRPGGQSSNRLDVAGGELPGETIVTSLILHIGPFSLARQV